MQNPFTINHLLLLFMFSLPVTAWEVSRKIRSKDKETNYETFSMIFGARKAALIPFVALLISGAISIYLGYFLSLGLSFYILNIILILYISLIYSRFISKPINKNNVLKNQTMIFTSFLFFNMLAHVLLSYKVISAF